MRGGIISFLSMIVLLAGCSFGSVTSEEAIEKSQEAMKEIESLEIKYKEKETDYSDKGTFQINLKDDISHYEFEEMDIIIYLEDDKSLLEDPTGVVTDIGADPIIEELGHRVDFLVEPFDTLEEFDEDFINHLEVEKNKDKDELILTYVVDEEDEEASHDFAKGYLAFALYGPDFKDSMDIIDEDMDISEVSFEMTLNDADYTIKQMKWDMDYKENDEEMTLKHQYSFGKYDEIGEIKALEEDTSSTGASEQNDGNNNSLFSLTSDDGVDPDEAASYLDALIQATVFQDVDGFVSVAPESMSKEDSQEEAEVQRDFFKEIYIENTRANMEGTGVTDEQIETLADDFLNALGKTNYEVIDAEPIEDNTVVVTVSIEGLDDAKVYADTDDELMTLIESGDVTEENIIDKNMEILSEQYENVDILDAVEVQVHVVKEGDNYIVLSQDEFLIGGFVQ